MVQQAALNERQSKAMAERVEEAKAHDVDMRPFEPWDASWHGRFEDETRPGRGNDFSGVWCDGERMVQITLDVYGNGHMSIADVDWTHGGEDCDCDVCQGLDDCPACDTPLSGCSPDDVCCSDCPHAANWA